MIEEFREFKGYEGFIQISNFGRIKSFVMGGILKPKKDKNGYLFVNLDPYSVAINKKNTQFGCNSFFRS